MLRQIIHKNAALAGLLATLWFGVPDARAVEMQDMPVVKLRALDKVTARTMTFEVRIGSTVRFGPVYIKAQACRKTPPTEKPEAASFLQIWEVNVKDAPQWIFSGWMFSSSPALSSMDHPVYDVWVLDCLERKSDEIPPAASPAPKPEIPPAPEGEATDEELEE